MKKFIDRYNKLLLLTAGVLVYIVLFAIFYPPIYAIQDEADYFDFAYRIKEGTIYFDPLTSHKIFFNGKNYVDMYSPGISILLLPFTFIHWKSLFLLNFLLHLLGFIFFIKSLKLLKIDIIYSLLYLFSPSFILYSRTLMPDVAAGSLTTIAIYFYLKEERINKFLSGLIFGFLTLIKNVFLLIPITFFLCLFIKRYFKSRQNKIAKQEILSFLIGLLPFVFLAVGYNFVAFKNIISTPVATGGVLSVRFLPSHIAFYFTFLILFYPFMLFAPFLSRQKNKLEFIFSTLLFVFFMSMWYFIQPAEGFLKRLIVGSRYLLAVLPIYILIYAEIINRFFAKIKRCFKSFVFISVFLGLIFSAYLINTEHQEYLRHQSHYRDTLYKNTHEGSFIVCNFEALELLQRIWGNRKWAPFTNPNLREYIKTLDGFYIVVFLRKDKPEDLVKDTRAKDEFVKEYNAYLVAEIKKPYNLQIYRARR